MKVLVSLVALAASNSLDGTTADAEPALEAGPAYRAASGDEAPAEPAGQAAEDAPAAGRLSWQPPIRQEPDVWPTYRGNVTRSGSTPAPVPARLDVAWQTRLGPNLTAPVVAGGRLLAASNETCTLHALDAATGRPLWQFPAGGPIDSPPTLDGPLCLLGCRDGSVYCLRASDGQLVWRFRVSGIDRRVVADNRLESVWPVHGSVLVEGGVVYFAAGRSSYLDGGIRLCGLDARSGRPLYRATVASTPVRPGKAPASGTGALPDLLVSDGRWINMRHLQFAKDLTLREAAEIRTLVASTGLLEDLWAHRQNWCLGYPRKINSRQHAGRIGARKPSASPPAGKLIVFDDQHAYCVMNPYSWLKHTPELFPPDHDGHLHQKYARYEADRFPTGTRIYACANRAGPAPTGLGRRASRPAATSPGISWQRDMPLQTRAMILAADTLFLAGWLDAVAIQERTGRPRDPARPDPRPARLYALAADDGRTLAEYRLPGQPVFDGLAAARGRLYLTLQDGTALCLAGAE